MKQLRVLSQNEIKCKFQENQGTGGEAQWNMSIGIEYSHREDASIHDFQHEKDVLLK